MNRSFLNEEEQRWLKKQEPTEEKTSKKQKDYSEYIDYCPKYSDLFIEEVEKKEKERIDKWTELLTKQHQNLPPEKWLEVKQDIYMRVNEDLLESDILGILRQVENNF